MPAISGAGPARFSTLAVRAHNALEGMMSLTKPEMPDRSKINMDVPLEVKQWSKQLGVDRKELQEAVEKVGNSATAVRKELQNCRSQVNQADAKPL